jgi:hypothetical protein
MNQSEFSNLFAILCANYRKDKAKVQDAYDLFYTRFGKEDYNTLNRAINSVCDSSKYFPTVSDIYKELRSIKPVKNNGGLPDFEHCQRCGGTGKVTLILGVERCARSGKKKIRHRRLWHIDDRALQFEEENITRQDVSAFCKCEKGGYLYQACGSDGITLSEMEFAQ